MQKAECVLLIGFWHGPASNYVLFSLSNVFIRHRKSDTIYLNIT